jgi:hypothetical protein
MQKGFGKTKSGKSASLGFYSQCRPAVARSHNINRKSLVLGQRRTAHRRIPERASMRRREAQRAPHRVTQRLQTLKKGWVVPIGLPAEPPVTPTSQFRQAKIRPAPSRAKCTARV